MMPFLVTIWLCLSACLKKPLSSLNKFVGLPHCSFDTKDEINVTEINTLRTNYLEILRTNHCS